MQETLARRREDCLRAWAREATEEAAKKQAGLSRDRAKTWREKLRTAVEQGKPRIFTAWVADEQGPPLSVVETREGNRLVQPRAVVQAFVAEWGGELWRPMDEGDMDEVLGQTLRGMAAQGAPAPLTAEQIKEAVDTMPARRSPGLDHWTVQQLKGLPAEAWVSLALILNQVEREGRWPAALRGAKIVFLSKGEGMQVIKQRPIGILPLLYRVWAKARLRQAVREHWVEPQEFEHGGRQDGRQQRRPGKPR